MKNTISVEIVNSRRLRHIRCVAFKSTSGPRELDQLAFPQNHSPNPRLTPVEEQPSRPLSQMPGAGGEETLRRGLGPPQCKQKPDTEQNIRRRLATPR